MDKKKFRIFQEQPQWEQGYVNKTKRSISLWMFACGSLLERSLTLQESTSSSVQRSTGCIYRDQTGLDYSPPAKLSTNKGNDTLSHRSPWKVTLKGKKISQNIQQMQVYLKYRQGKMKGFFSGLALHMTAIWEYCVFWPRRVVYDRWQGGKSRAAGLSTDMQIAFSWLLNSVWYLSSGLQHVSLFEDRKQLINPTTGGQTGSWRFFLHQVKVQTLPVAGEHLEI